MTTDHAHTIAGMKLAAVDGAGDGLEFCFAVSGVVDHRRFAQDVEDVPRICDYLFYSR